MIEVSVEFFDGELSFVAELADHFFQAVFFLGLAIVAVVDLIFWDLLKPIACEVEAGVARVAVEDLIGIVVEGTETNFAVCFKKFIVCLFFTFGRFDLSLAVDKLLELLQGFICEAVFEVFEDGDPHEVVSNGLYLLGGVRVSTNAVVLFYSLG